MSNDRVDETANDTHHNKTHDNEQPLIQHLLELRNRLLRMVLIVLVIFAGLFYFANDIYSIVSAPLRALLPANSTMIATDVASPFFTPFKLTLYTALFVAMPFILFQIWGFIAPALYEREKRLALPILLSSIVLFYAGIAFAYFVVFPLIFAFFTSVGPADVTLMTDISSYLDFVMKLFFAFGLAFEIPVATVLLLLVGVITPQALSEKRPYVIVFCFVFGMLLTPPDVLSQTLLAVPMWMLFEVGLFVGRLLIKPQASADSDDTDTSPSDL